MQRSSLGMVLSLFPAALLGGCSSTDTHPATTSQIATVESAAPDQPTEAAPAPADEADSWLIPASQQRPGNPEAGYRALSSEGYVGCGMPWSIVKDRMGKVPDSQKLPNRPGQNADLPYHLNLFTTASGVEVMTSNCLACHAGYIDGKLVVGLGNIHGDFTREIKLPPAAMAYLLAEPARSEFRKWHTRINATVNHSRTLTIGVNAADTFTAVLFAHRDPKTLAWLDKPAMELPSEYVIRPMCLPGGTCAKRTRSITPPPVEEITRA